MPCKGEGLLPLCLREEQQTGDKVMNYVCLWVLCPGGYFWSRNSRLLLVNVVVKSPAQSHALTFTVALLPPPSPLPFLLQFSDFYNIRGREVSHYPTVKLDFGKSYAISKDLLGLLERSRLPNGSAHSLLIRPHRVNPGYLQEYFCCQIFPRYSFKPLTA